MRVFPVAFVLIRVTFVINNNACCDPGKPTVNRWILDNESNIREKGKMYLMSFISVNTQPPVNIIEGLGAFT